MLCDRFGPVLARRRGRARAVRLSTGDCFLLPRGWPFRLASDLALTSVDALSVFPRPANGGIAIWNGGGDFSSVGGHFTLAGEHAGVMLGMLPPIVHLKTEADKAALRWYLDRMRQELRERLPGGFLVVEHLVHMMLVQAPRLHLAEGANGGVGWLFALADKQMGAAVAAMHENPERRWTLQLLAERVGMSRSSFALKFKEIVGVVPMDYLTRWRMLLAGDKLANSHYPIAAIATSVGYDSESAFSTAFRRIKGRSPRQYGQRTKRRRRRLHLKPARRRAWELWVEERGEIRGARYFRRGVRHDERDRRRDPTAALSRSPQSRFREDVRTRRVRASARGDYRGRGGLADRSGSPDYLRSPRCSTNWRGGSSRRACRCCAPACIAARFIRSFSAPPICGGATKQDVKVMIAHEIVDTIPYPQNPVRRVREGGETLRRRIDSDDAEFDFSVLHDLKSAAPPNISPCRSQAPSALEPIWRPMSPIGRAGSPNARSPTSRFFPSGCRSSPT